MSKDYESIYKKSDLYWGKEPSNLVKRFAELAPQGKALDLGMGEGRDMLYLASLGFEATGIEMAESGVSKCDSLAEERKLRVDAIQEDARKYHIAKNRFALIIAMNLFQFMSKDDATKIIVNARAGLKKGGLFLCTAFTVDDPACKVYKKNLKEVAPGVFVDGSGNVRSYYHYGELLNMGSSARDKSVTGGGLRTIHYAEFDYYDTMHGLPHWHGVVEFVGKKIS